MFSIIGILIVVIAGVLLLLHLRMLRAIRATSNIPGPPIVPILGNALEFGCTPVDISKNIMRICTEYKQLVKIWMGPIIHAVGIMDPKIAEVVLSSTKLIDKNSEYSFLQEWLGEGLLLSTGQKWRKRRKILTPAFHFSILEQNVDSFTSAAQILVKQLAKHSDRKVFDVYPYITLCALDVICESSMGIKLNAQLHSNSEYVSAVRDACGIIHNRMFSVVKRAQFVFNLTSDGRRYKKCLKLLHSVTDDVIQTRRKLLPSPVNGQNAKEFENDDGIKKRHAFLDILLQSTIDGRPLTNADIREEVNTFMFEGHDTVSSAIAFALYLLSNNPEIQDKLLTEIQDITGNDTTNTASYSDLQSMKYLEAVIKETLRLYPSVPLFGRKLTHDIEIRNQILPKGTDVLLIAIMMQRNADIYPEPEKFDPDRFLDNDLQRNAFAYVPFSAGSRNCIGQKFAMIEMKAVISTIVRHYEILPAGPGFEPELIMAIVLKSNNGIHIKIKPRILL